MRKIYGFTTVGSLDGIEKKAKSKNKLNNKTDTDSREEKQ